ncbi:hypothetical protein [Natronomonas sp. LN261]|jgi:hypothetical protein|uniref:DUF7521 family protein n=1 Tax=Natronomonas sp. LN261 TaxID=2750669 RepID=UPI0015EF2EE3|nr:hypothetical protein [Natronomonas sp. LN261]
MNPLLPTVVVALKTITLVLGGLISLYAYRAARRTGSSSLRMLAIGFGLITVGSLLAGIVDQLLPIDSTVALVVESLFTLVGFGAILRSLWMSG